MVVMHTSTSLMAKFLRHKTEFVQWNIMVLIEINVECTFHQKSSTFELMRPEFKLYKPVLRVVPFIKALNLKAYSQGLSKSKALYFKGEKFS